jgi:hypothetical protein
MSVWLRIRSKLGVHLPRLKVLEHRNGALAIRHKREALPSLKEPLIMPVLFITNEKLRLYIDIFA